MTSDKIKNLPDACAQMQAWQANQEQVVFTNGCFDIVHLGHIHYLEIARAKGQRLVVGLNTDASVKRLKGEKRPIVSEYARARMMASFEFVDLVVLFEEDTPKDLVEALKPDIMVKGSDYNVSNIAGADFVLARGGKVEIIDSLEGISTSNIIQKIQEAYS